MQKEMMNERMETISGLNRAFTALYDFSRYFSNIMKAIEHIKAEINICEGELGLA